MKKLLTTGCFFTSAALFVTGCASTPVPDQNLTVCTDRSPVCTQNYNPVCGQNNNNEWKTYSNACTACSNKNVVGYKPGECP
jgi:hypothetical protein